MKKVFVILSAVLLSTSLFAEDHVMAATKSYYGTQDSVPSSLSLSLRDAQNYAIKQNRSLRNASLAVQEAYASVIRLRCPQPWVSLQSTCLMWGLSEPLLR